MSGVPKIMVIGSCMIDLCCYASRLPKPGETVLGKKFVKGFGGKGANQCIAASKLGACVGLVARLGDDTFGEEYLESLKSDGINTTCINITKDSSSGMAQITIADSGENQIVIVAGANAKLSTEDVMGALPLMNNASVLVFQFETPLEVIVKALKLFSGRGKSIVNGAPGVVSPDPQIYTLSDIFCVNETEAEISTGVSVKNVQDAGKAIASLLKKGCNGVVITLGAQGAVFATKKEPTPVHVPTRKVTPVDTTGAGDAFIGAMAYYLAYLPDLPLVEVVKRSCEIASISVEKSGTQTSFPHHNQLSSKLLA